MRPGRDAKTHDALDLLLWVAARETPISKYDVADLLGCHPRTALRWLHGLERVGAVELVSGTPTTPQLAHWQRRAECFQCAGIGKRAGAMR